MTPGLRIEEDDPRNPEVSALLERHLAFAREYTPAEHIHALPVDHLTGPDIRFFSARVDGRVVAVGALRHLDHLHVELKSMHTAEAARGRGLGRAMVAHLLDMAEASGATRASLETGTMAAFAPARALYAAVGFRPCAPFGDYEPTPSNTFMTIDLPRSGDHGQDV